MRIFPLCFQTKILYSFSDLFYVCYIPNIFHRSGFGYLKLLLSVYVIKPPSSSCHSYPQMDILRPIFLYIHISVHETIES